MWYSWLNKSLSWGPHCRQGAVAVVEVLCVCVPVIVLCQNESLLMQGSSCSCDSLSHSRSGRTISVLPAALSQSLHNTHTLHRVKEPLPQSCWGDKEWRGECVWESLTVCVGWEGCVQRICPFQFAFLHAHGRLCKMTDLLLQHAADTDANWRMHFYITLLMITCFFLKSSQTLKTLHGNFAYALTHENDPTSLSEKDIQVDRMKQIK